MGRRKLKKPPIRTVIGRILAEPNRFDYPAPIVIKNTYGHTMLKCPEGCDGYFSTRPNGYTQHYTIKHRPKNYGYKAQLIMKVLS